MKKLLFLLLTVVLAVNVNAQAAFQRSRTGATSINVLTNTDTIQHVIKVPGAVNATITLEVSLTSGTFGGKAYLYGSTSGGKYELLDSSAVYSANDFAGTGFIKTWYLAPARHLFYRVTTLSTGTVSENPVVYGLFKPLYYSPVK